MSFLHKLRNSFLNKSSYLEDRSVLTVNDTTPLNDINTIERCNRLEAQFYFNLCFIFPILTYLYFRLLRL